MLFSRKCGLSTSSAIGKRPVNIDVQLFYPSVQSDVQSKMKCNVNAGLACYGGLAITPASVTTRP